jgi:hypothetical protein
MKLSKTTMLFVAGAVLMVTAPAKANLIHDGDFSNPYQGTSPTSYTYAPTGSPWTFSDLIPGVSGSGITYIPSNFQNTPLYTQVGFLQTAGGTISSSDPASISQSFTAPTAGTYDLSFVYAGRSYDGGTTTFTVSVDGNVVDTLTPSSGQPLTPQSFDISLASGINYLAFTATGVSGNDETAFIDNVNIGAVPESTTMIAGVLLLLPLGVSAVRIMRKNVLA